jgi:dihydroorotase/N-acyl-D-amino-acid deacylase
MIAAIAGRAWTGPCMALLIAATSSLPAQQRVDLVIRGGTVIDGTGAAGFQGDLAVRDGRIVRVSRSPIDPSSAQRVIDATGLVVSPGFIDLHAHIEGIKRMPDAESEVRQGVTLALGGPDGGGPAHFASYLRMVDSLPLGLNVGYLTGHNSIRGEVIGMADRAPTPDELERMKLMVAEAMHAGAFGISTGLFYLPGIFSKVDEVIALSKVAADSGGIYTSHLRNEGARLFDGVAEAIEIGKQAHIPIVLTHHKAVGQPNWGKSIVTLAMIDWARSAGIDVMADQYPYTASSTALAALIPPWALEGGDSAFRRRAKDPVLLDSLTRGIIWNLENDRGGGEIRRVQFASVGWNRALEGRTLRDWAVERGLEPTPANGATLVVEGQLAGGASMIYHVMDEADVERIMKHPMTMIGSDGALSRPGMGVPHPRSYGTFPRVLGVYVREKQVLTLEDAVRKMTSLPARRLGLNDRGTIAEGNVADITIFDPKVVNEQGTWTNPHQYPIGIPYVIVNGVAVVDGGKFTDRRPGKVLRRPN